MGISSACYQVYNAIENGTLSYSVHVLEQGERLDYLAGINYGDSSLWWVLAAASGIGWWLQVPAGTRIVIPLSIDAIGDLL